MNTNQIKLAQQLLTEKQQKIEQRNQQQRPGYYNDMLKKSWRTLHNYKSLSTMNVYSPELYSEILRYYAERNEFFPS